jgi:stearoyl-CoA desaturase (delta-9 desaturase)
VSTLANVLVVQPSVLLRRTPWFYFWYDGVWMALVCSAVAALWFSGWPGLITDWQPWHFALIPAALYLHILANVCVHNCCHGNFPRAINRVIGEILGVIVFTRYASWEVLHQRHHRFSDDPEKDPHPVHPSFWVFLYRIMTVNLERQLQNEFFDNHGASAIGRRRENARSVLSFSVMIPLAAFWWLFLGTEALFFIYLPVSIVGWIHVAHFNWVTHNAHSPDRDYHPVNLDTGWFWIGNRIWFGLYMHGNHHKRANIFNPLHMDRVVARRAARRAAADPPEA